jgi:hypothetical protein
MKDNDAQLMMESYYKTKKKQIDEGPGNRHWNVKLNRDLQPDENYPEGISKKGQSVRHDRFKNGRPYYHNSKEGGMDSRKEWPDDAIEWDEVEAKSPSEVQSKKRSVMVALDRLISARENYTASADGWSEEDFKATISQIKKSVEALEQAQPWSGV